MLTLKGRMASALRAFLITLSGLGVLLVASAGPQDEAGFFWVASTNGAINIATDTGAIRFERAHTLGYTNLAINDVNGDAWAYRFPDLVSYDRLGNPRTTTSVPTDLQGIKPVDLVVDGSAGNLWMAGRTSLFLFDLSGAHQETIEVSAPIIAISLDRTSSKLWVGLKDELRVYGENGALEQTFAIEGASLPTTWLQDVAFDRLLNELWVARADRLERYNSTGTVTFTQLGDFKGRISPDGANGLWTAFLDTIRHISPDGSTDVTLKAFDGQADKLIVDLVGDPADASVWVASSTRIRQYAVDGELLHDITPPSGTIQKLARAALYADLDAPELDFTFPANNSAHTTATPTFSLAFFDLGVGPDTTTLAFKVDGVGRTFNCTFTASTATCTPNTALADGTRAITATIKDRVGNESATAQRTVLIDTTPPVITIAQPADGSYTNQVSASITGSISEPGTLTINGNPVAVDGSNGFAHGATLVEGANAFALVATDALGLTGSASLTINLDTVAPAAPQAASITASTSSPGQITVTGTAGSVEGGATVRVRNTRTGQVVTTLAAADGSFTTNLAGVLEDELEITQIDLATNASAAIVTLVVPPNPAGEGVAPALSEAEFTPMQEAVAFLYTGANPVQIGVVNGAVDPYRVAVLKGRVLDRADEPLPGVRITVKDHPELGYTLSRADGAFDMVVNGGGSVFLNYELEGHLPVQRQIETPWRDYTAVDDVVMTTLDTAVTTVTPGVNSPAQLASGNAVTDAAGTRQTTMLFPSGLTASMTLPDGSSVALSSMDVRATEYTVGANGPRAMPAALPPTSGYTYAVELSIDQALAAGAREVQFSKPVPVYVDNFLAFPVGEDVPSGYYDRDKGAWVPEPDGRIVKVLSEDPVAGAVLDVSGNNQPATAAQLTGLGITAEERIAIAAKYAPGNQFWRVPVTHFSARDFNYPVGVPNGAQPPPETMSEKKPEPVPNAWACELGCVIEPTRQSLGEDLSLVGVPYSMHYRSARTPSGRPNSRIVIPVTGETVPPSIKHAVVEVAVAGQIYRKTFTAFALPPNLKHEFEWDGRDAYGRLLVGTYQADITVGFVYPAVFYSSAAGVASSFGAAANPNVAIGIDRANREVVLQRRFTRYLPGLHPTTGGWSFNVHHSYDYGSQILHRGDGGHEAATNMVIKTIAGNGTTNAWDIPATSSSIQPYGPMAVSAAGDVYFTQNTVYPTTVFRVDSAGYLRRVAYGLEFRIDDMDFGPDGRLYLLTKTQAGAGPMIRRMDVTTGAVSTYLAAGGISGDSYSIDVAADGSVYVVDPYCHQDGFPFQRIRRITPSGENIVHFQLHTPYCQGGYFRAVAVGPDGTVYIGGRGNAGRGVTMFTPQGAHLTFLPGSATPGFGDGGPVSQAGGDYVVDLVTGPDGTVYIMEDNISGVKRMRAVTPDGVINTIAGGGGLTVQYAEGAPARAVKLGAAQFALGPDGALYENAGFWLHMRKIASVFPTYSPSTFAIVSRDGRKVYTFTNSGRHLNTRDAFSGTTLHTFAYNAQGKLASITDVDGDVTTIEHNGAGKPSAIVGPDGHRTELTTDANGYLNSVTSPAGEVYQMTYDAGGLLKTFKNPRLQTASYTYDPDTGGLSTDVNAHGGGWTLGVTRVGQSTTTTMTSAEGRVSSFLVERQATNDLRQVMTGPDGTASTLINRTDAVTTFTAPDGTTSEVKELADPRFGLQSPVTTSTIKTPSNLTAVTTITRTATLSDKYNPLSLMDWKQVTSLNGKNFETSYAPMTKTWTSKSHVGRQSETTVDAKGRPLTSKYANFETTNYTFNAQGRLGQLSTGSAPNTRTTTFAYYPSGASKGFLQTVTDAENRTVSYDYDDAGRVTKQTLPDSRFIQYSYDTNGNLTSLTPPGRDAHVFSYNAGDLEDQYTPPDATNVGTRVTQYAYNLDKDLELITRPDGQTVDFVYSGLGKKLTSIVIPTGTYDYTYIPATGQLDTLAAPGGQGLDYSYDGFLLTSEVASGVVNGTVSWVYNIDFRVTSQTAAGSAISFGYDNDGLLTTAGALTLTRNPTHGLITSTTLATNATTSHTYNTFGEPATDEAKYGSTILYSASYPVRDKLGRIKQKVETVQGTQHTYDYAYDPAGRLHTVTKDSVLVSDYGYDSNGNRTTVNGATVATYDGQDRLLSYNGATYTYTANGELLTKTDGTGTTTYGYDVLGNLRTVRLPDGTDIEYVIDGRNRRVGRKVNGTLVQGFLYGNQLEPVAELDGSGSLVARFVYGSKAHVPDYMVKAGVTYRVVSDHLGSVRLIVNTTNGSIAQRVDYDEFGNVTNDTSSGFQPFGFAGGIYDQDTRFIRFGARDYEPITGRWTAKDPIAFEAGPNLYAYVVNDPIRWIDPTGEAETSPDATLRAAIQRGDVQQIEAVMEALGPVEQAAARKAIERLTSTAEQVIQKELRGSVYREFPGELRQKTLQEIYEGAGAGDKACRTAKKLLNDSRFKK